MKKCKQREINKQSNGIFNPLLFLFQSFLRENAPAKLLLFLLVCTRLSAQNISGVVISTDNDPIPMASVQLLQDGTAVAYAVTDIDGKYTLNATAGLYTAQISHWSFQTKEALVRIISEAQEQNFTLEPKNVELSEVLLEAQGLLVKKKGDTLSYNLQALTDGSEQKLKDLLNKLPGVEVNPITGKITAQGKPIDDLLINGQRLFGDNHRLATENLPANMLSEIDLIHNYESFGAVKDIEGGSRTAMNISIKEDFFGKITGSAEVLAGYEEAYLAHAKLLQIGKKLSFSAIADANNIGKEALTVFDFIELSGSIRGDIRQMGIRPKITLMGFPRFLLAEKSIAQKQSQMLALHSVAVPTSKWQLNAYAIAARSNFSENISSMRQYFAQPTSFVQIQNSQLRHYNWLGKFHSDYRFSPNAQLSYTFSFSQNDAWQKQANEQKQASFPAFSFEEEQAQKNLGLEQQLTFIQKLSKYSLLSLNAYHQYKSDDNAPVILYQNQSIRTPIAGASSQAGGFAKYSLKLPWQHLFSSVLGYDYQREKRAYSFATDALTKAYAYSFVGLMRKNATLEYNLIAELRHYHTPRHTLFLPQALLKYSFRKDLHYVQGHYMKDVRFPELSKLNSVSHRQNFNDTLLPSLLQYSDVKEEQNLGFAYHYQSFYHGMTLSFESDYSLFGKNIALQTNYVVGQNQLRYRSANGGYQWENEARAEYRLFKLKQVLLLQGEYLQGLSYFYNDDVLSQNKQQVTKVKIALKSNFKHKPLGYELGFSVAFAQNELSPLHRQMHLWEQAPYLNILLNMGRWQGEFKHKYAMAFSKEQKHNYWDIAYSFGYQKPSSKWSYFLLAENFFNLHQHNFLRTAHYATHYEIQKAERLRGFLGIGAKYQW